MKMRTHFRRPGWGAAAPTLAVIALAAGLAGCGGGGVGGAHSFALGQPAPLERWEAGGPNGLSITTANYNLYSTTDAEFTRAMAGFLEACHANYTALTGLTAPSDQPWAVYLLGTRPEWALMTARVTGPAARYYLQLESGAYCHDGVCVMWYMGRLPTYSTAAHEGLHQFLHHAVRQPLPGWAEEGLAVLAEAFRIHDGKVTFDPQRNTLRFTDLRRALQAGRWRTTEELLTMDAGDNISQAGGMHTGVDYYGQLWALLLLIRSDPQYAAGLQRMLQDAAAGRLDTALELDGLEYMHMGRRTRRFNRLLGPRAFEHYIDADLDRFEQRFRRFANDLVGIR